MSKIEPLFPLYIPSKGRWESRITVRHLEAMGLFFYVIVEEQEYNHYSSLIDKSKILILDPKFKQNYDPCDDLGDAKSKGSGAARNFGWEHSIKNGFTHHWMMDDNIRGFYRLNNNLKIKCLDGAFFRAMEDFVLRYKNIGMSGPNYHTFAYQRLKMAPFKTNTRIYSCNLIKNDIPFRWAGRYNEDTHLSLRMLKAGWCTVQFNAFLQGKVTTQSVKGGNTADFYSKEGTSPKSQMLYDLHPDITRLVHRFGRAHHHVDYSGFKKNKLIKNKNVVLTGKPNNYGMSLKVVK